MKKSDFIKAVVVAMLIVAATLFFSQKAEEKDSFSIIVLPDTQLYAGYHPEIFFEQTIWIRRQKEALNIVCVIHEGDITHNNRENEWLVADQAMNILNDIVPYCMVVGNHDLGPCGYYNEKRDCALFNKYFGVYRFVKKSWYGGHFGSGNENAFYLIDTATMNFLILCLEFGPRDEVLQWAGNIVATYKDRKAIIVTHCYTHCDDTRVGEKDNWRPSVYGCEGNDGEKMWNKFVRKHENIFLVLSGHILGDGIGRLTSTGNNGNKVHQILANYQMLENGGNGWLRIMKFLPRQRKIAVETYSPSLKKYKNDDQNKFKIKY